MNKFLNKMKEFEANIEAEVDTVVDWIKNKFKESGAKGAILGMSGGVDCCTVARLLQKADIPVLLVKMPYGRSMDFAGDKKDANELIERFNFDSFTIDITDEVDMIVSRINVNGVKLTEMAKANIMPRVRMTNLYAIGQANGYLVVGTGNLSERTMGYFTKWGDGACDFNPLANFTKTEVKIMARYLEVPERIITKAPSANLWENQTDEDEMGMSYADLDRYILTGEGTDDIKEKVETAKKKVAHKNNPIDVFKREI